MWEYQATVARVVDGDTLDLEINLGFHVHHRVRVRLLGVDTPETFGVKKESEEYRKGLAAKHFVLDWLLDHGVNDDRYNPSRRTVTITSHDGGHPRAGKYGRWLVRIYGPKEMEILPEEVYPESLNEALLREGYAVEYDGGPR